MMAIMDLEADPDGREPRIWYDSNRLSYFRDESWMGSGLCLP